MYFLIFSLSLFLTKMTHLLSWYPTLSPFLSSLLSRPYSSVFLFEIYPDVCHTDKLENRSSGWRVSNGAKLPHWYSRIRTAWSYDRYVHRFRRERPARETMGINSIRKSRDRALTNWKKSFWDSLVPSKWSYGAVFVCAWLVEIH